MPEAWEDALAHAKATQRTEGRLCGRQAQAPKGQTPNFGRLSNRMSHVCPCVSLYHISSRDKPRQPCGGIFFTCVDQPGRGALQTRSCPHGDGRHLRTALEGVRFREAELDLLARQANRDRAEAAVFHLHKAPVERKPRRAGPENRTHGGEHLSNRARDVAHKRDPVEPEELPADMKPSP